MVADGLLSVVAGGFGVLPFDEEPLADVELPFPEFPEDVLLPGFVLLFALPLFPCVWLPEVVLLPGLEVADWLVFPEELSFLEEPVWLLLADELLFPEALSFFEEPSFFPLPCFTSSRVPASATASVVVLPSVFSTDSVVAVSVVVLSASPTLASICIREASVCVCAGLFALSPHAHNVRTRAAVLNVSVSLFIIFLLILVLLCVSPTV